MKISFAIGLLAMLPLAAFAQAARRRAASGHRNAASCAPSMGLNFVCGLDQPEDLLQIGGSKWVIASGMGEHGGIFLVDSRGQDRAALFHRRRQARY